MGEYSKEGDFESEYDPIGPQSKKSLEQADMAAERGQAIAEVEAAELNDARVGRSRGESVEKVTE